MQFNQVIIEVDGTLANPVVGLAVVIWSLLLSAGAVRLLAQYQRARTTSGKQNAGRRAGILIRLAFLFVVTPIAQPSLGTLIYQVESLFSDGSGVTSVGFWGGPPVLPAWIVALVCMAAAVRRGARLPQAGDDGTP